MVENSNQHHISWCVCAHIRFQIEYQLYTELEFQSACIARILLKTVHPVILQEYGVPKSSLTRVIRKIYPLLQSRNLDHQQKRVEVGAISLGKVISVVKLIVLMKKEGQQTYLNEDEDSLVIASANIEGGHGLTLDCTGLSHEDKAFFSPSCAN